MYTTKKIAVFFAIFVFLFCCCEIKAQTKNSIKAYNIDYNWNPGGGYINAFAKPGLWADADPEKLMQWYEDLGCNVVHSFAVSCNGYAWYKNGVVPEQPGLASDFLTTMVKIGRKKKMQVFGYFCIGANTKWGLDHPGQSYGTPASPHIPFTNAYIGYLCASIKDAIQKTDVDGVMLDWIWPPSTESYNGITEATKWLPCEQEMYSELFNKPFPGKDSVTQEINQAFRTKSIDRLWKRVYETVKTTKKNCLIWITCSNVMSKDVAGSEMFRQTDWLMNEAGDIASTEAMKTMIGSQTKSITCLANWNNQDPLVVIPAAMKSGVAVYGFTKPTVGPYMPPVDEYLKKPVTGFTGDDKNLAALVRSFKGLSMNYVKQ